MLGERPVSDRGQLLVITALVVAIVLVGLALVLNSAIYTENLSSRESADSAEVTNAMASGEAEIERAMRNANHNDNASHDAVNLAFDSIVSDVGNDTTDQYAKRGATYRFAVVDRTNGTHLRHTNSSKSFVSGGSDADQGDWLLAGNVPHLRDYRMTVQPRYLYSTPDENLDDLMDNAFHVSVTGEGGDGNTVTWEIYVYENDDEVIVFGGEETDLLDADTLDDLPTFDDDCRGQAAASDDDVEIDVSNGTVAGAQCPGLAFQSSFEGGLSIRYGNADDSATDQSRSGGTYELAIGTTSYEDQHFHDPQTSDDSPFATHIIYDARVESHYARDDVTHDRVVRVYPGVEAYDS